MWWKVWGGVGREVWGWGVSSLQVTATGRCKTMEIVMMGHVGEGEGEGVGSGSLIAAGHDHQGLQDKGGLALGWEEGRGGG